MWFKMINITRVFFSFWRSGYEMIKYRHRLTGEVLILGTKLFWLILLKVCALIPSSPVQRESAISSTNLDEDLVNYVLQITQLLIMKESL